MAVLTLQAFQFQCFQFAACFLLLTRPSFTPLTGCLEGRVMHPQQTTADLVHTTGFWEENYLIVNCVIQHFSGVLCHQPLFPKDGHCSPCPLNRQAWARMPGASGAASPGLWHWLMFVKCVQVIELRRPMDSRLEHVDFECLFKCLSVRQIIRIFASLLLERRVIFVADKLR